MVNSCVFCGGSLEWTMGGHSVRWNNTIITVPDARYMQCAGCGRITFDSEEGLRLISLAKEEYEINSGG